MNPRDVTAPQPGPHGGDGALLAQRLGIPMDAVLDLSLSLNPVAPDVSALVAEHARAVRRYPDPESAVTALADAMGVARDRLLLTNGGAEAIALVAGVFPDGWVDEPDFSLYARHLERLNAGAPRWRSNPHNPSGRLAPADATAGVWDEAFYPLATGRWTRGDPHAVVVGSLTKLFACPGLRIGYILAPEPDLATQLRARQSAWSVNALACATLPALLASADLRGWSDAIARLRADLVTVLTTAGLDPDESDANYVLVRHGCGVREYLAQHGILVRDTESFGLSGGMRIAVPDNDGIARVADALTDWNR